MLGTPSHEQQRTLEEIAYQSWLNRGCPAGSPEVDWDHACRVLKIDVTRVESAQPQAEPDPTFKELGSDEDTSSDPQAVSPFEAAAENSLDAAPTPKQSKTPRPAGGPSTKSKRGKGTQSN
ncbi:MAG TPA: DUF2934 domain-containing protein [Steroidobacteraceae bacterium]|nr:DUF2934 domain-containing protein [Steroidobacteraceae bacterium]